MGLSIQDSATSYIELSSKVYSLFLGALASRTKRRLQYWKSVWEVSSQPNQSTGIDGTVRVGFDRAGQILDLTANELKTDGQKVAEFSEKLLSYATTCFEAFSIRRYRASIMSRKRPNNSSAT